MAPYSGFIRSIDSYAGSASCPYCAHYEYVGHGDDCPYWTAIKLTRKQARLLRLAERALTQLLDRTPSYCDNCAQERYPAKAREVKQDQLAEKAAREALEKLKKGLNRK